MLESAENERVGPIVAPPQRFGVLLDESFGHVVAKPLLQVERLEEIGPFGI